MKALVKQHWHPGDLFRLIAIAGTTTMFGGLVVAAWTHLPAPTPIKVAITGWGVFVAAAFARMLWRR